MDIQFKLIKADLDKLKVYELRKKIFVDEENRFPYSLDHIVDQYDSLEESFNWAAILNDEMIAAVRVTLDSKSGLPIDKYQEISEFKKQLTRPCINIGWLCCTKPYRHKTGLLKSLLRHAVSGAQKQGFHHLLAVIHPPAYDMLHHCFKIEKIGSQFFDKQRDIPMLPVHVVINTMMNHLNGALPEKENSELQLKKLGFQSKYHFLEEALARNIGIFSLSEQDKLMESRVAIAGMGGVGGQHLVTLARTGINNFHIADFDHFEPVNFNRQYGAKTSNFGQAKIDVMYKEAKDINPFLDIKCFAQGVSEKNIDDFLDNVDLVADGMDFFNFDIRRLIFKKAYEKNIPVITAGPLGFSAAMLIFMPDRGMTFDQYFNITDKLDLEEKLIRFFIGLAPKATQKEYIDPDSISMKTRKGPSLGAACNLCSAVVAAETVRILLKKKGIKPAPYYFQYDLFTRKFHQGYLFKGNRHPLQKIKSKILKNRLKKNKPGNVLPDVLKVLPEALPEGLSGNKNISKGIITYLINAGCQAPSGDNCQPWSFEYSKPDLKVFLDPLADNSFFNLNQTASYIACGAAIENILIAASRYGISGEVKYLPNKKQPDLIANIHMSICEKQEDPLQRFIWERHTNRTKFNNQPMEQKDLDQIKECLLPFKETSLILKTKKDDINKIAGLVYKVDKIRAERRDLHEHLMKMIRFTNKEAELKKDGFPLKNLEAGIGGELFLKACYPWAIMNLINKMGMGKMISQIAGKSIRQASAVGLLKISGKSDKDLIIGGQALERLWLTCTRLGISFQPMTAVTLFRRRWESGMKNDFSLKHQQLLGKIWPVYEYLFDSNNNESHIMLFRLGYGKKISCRTLRKKCQ
ncbi:MAG: ThiF family adenylyltransferase [Desulfobacteraceae bacterium]|nr:ThiF family adenylyltransferase [Desulfobacteraceae bacterium]